MRDPDLKKARKKSRLFMGLANSIKSSFPSLKMQLKQAEVNLSTREAIAIALSRSAAMGTMYFIALMFLLYSSGFELGSAIMWSLAIGLLLFVFTYLSQLSHYKGIVRKRLKGLNKNLLYALQTMQIHISSGVPVFESMKALAGGRYGDISAEFKVVIEHVEGGSPLETELEELAMRNPSPNFRNAVWQIVNSIRTGADLTENIEAIIESISKEELVEIRRYGSKLNPLVLMYMMLAVIIPSMGVTVMVIISSMPGSTPLSETTFWMMLGALSVIQVMFIAMIRSKRPDVSVA